jgi:hypothetical protein
MVCDCSFQGQGNGLGSKLQNLLNVRSWLPQGVDVLGLARIPLADEILTNPTTPNFALVQKRGTKQFETQRSRGRKGILTACFYGVSVTSYLNDSL